MTAGEEELSKDWANVVRRRLKGKSLKELPAKERRMALYSGVPKRGGIVLVEIEMDLDVGEWLIGMNSHEQRITSAIRRFKDWTTGKYKAENLQYGDLDLELDKVREDWLKPVAKKKIVEVRKQGDPPPWWSLIPHDEFLSHMREWGLNPDDAPDMPELTEEKLEHFSYLSREHGAFIRALLDRRDVDWFQRRYYLKYESVINGIMRDYMNAKIASGCTMPIMPMTHFKNRKTS